MKLSVTNLRDCLGSALDRVASLGERIVLSRNGEDVAAIVSLKDLQLLEDLEDRIDLSLARRVLDEAARGQTESWHKVKRDLG